MVPTLLIGLGMRGSRIASAARTLAIGERPDAAPVLRLAHFRTDAGEADAADAVLTCVVDEATRRVALPQDATETLQRLANTLLEATGLQNAGIRAGADTDVLLIADAEDTSIQEIILPAAASIRAAIQGAVAGTSDRVILYLLAPKGSPVNRAGIVELLNTLRDAAQSNQGSLDQISLTTGASSTLTLEADELDTQLATLLALRSIDPVGDRIRQNERDAELTGINRMGSCGLAIIEIRIDDLKKQSGLQGAAKIVEQGINSPCMRHDDATRIADETIPRLGFAADGLKQHRDDLLHYQRGGRRRSVLDDIRVPDLALAQVPRTRWHIAFANYAVYFRRERLDVVLATVRHTTEAKRETIVQIIRTAVDRVINSGRDATNTYPLLERLHASALEARQNLLQNRLIEAPGQGAAVNGLDPLLPKLAEASAHEPWLPSMIVRGACASAVTALALMGLLRLGWLGDIPTTGTASIPYWGMSFVAPFIICAGLALRKANRARALTDRLAADCRQAIMADARTRIDAEVEKGLDTVTSDALFRTARPDDLQAMTPGYTGPSEWREVEALIQRLNEELPAAIQTHEPETLPGWRLDSRAFAAPEPIFEYADQNGFDDWTGEANTLIQSGLFSTWRSSSADDLARTIEAYAISRMDYLSRLTLDEFYRRWLDTPDTMLRIYNDMSSRAAPGVRVCGQTDDQGRWILIAGPGNGEGSFGVALRATAGNSPACTHASQYRAVMIRTTNGVDPHDLAAWSVWNAEPGTPSHRGDGS